MKSSEMSLNISGQSLTRIEVGENLLKCYRGDELFQVHSLEGITKLYCDGNQLTSLPDTLPGGLTTLDCSDNRLAKLQDTLPRGLITLYCSKNQLTSLPNTLPGGLTTLFCYGNRLTSLPDTLPEGLIVLDCSENPLKYIPYLPKRPYHLLVPEIFEEKHSLATQERYSEYYQKQQRDRYLFQLFFSEMGFSDDFLRTELERD